MHQRNQSIPIGLMIAAALCFAMSLPIAAAYQAQLHPLYWATIVRIVNGVLMAAAALCMGRGANIPWATIIAKPRGVRYLPILTIRCFDMAAVIFAARLVPYTVIASVLATYPIALIFSGWAATKGTDQPRPLTKRVMIAALIGIVGALIAVVGQPSTAANGAFGSALNTLMGFSLTVLASFLIGTSSFAPRVGIENALRDTQGRGEDDVKATSAITTMTIGATSFISAPFIMLPAAFIEPAPSLLWCTGAVLNGITLAAAATLWAASTVSSRTLAPQILCYGEPIGALILLAATGLAAGTNWPAIITGLAIVIAAGLIATLPKLPLINRAAT